MYYSIVKIGDNIFMDSRIFIVLVPILTAASWALFNIGRVALQQLKRMS